MRPSEKEPVELLHGELTKTVIGAFYEVYNELRYGFLEKIYVEALVRVLRRKGLNVEREVWVPIYFQGEMIGRQRIDLLVEDKLILEAKSTHGISESDHRQLKSYLHGSAFELGLLLHFGPEAKFYRTICTLRPPPRLGSDPSDQHDQPDPRGHTDNALSTAIEIRPTLGSTASSSTG